MPNLLQRKLLVPNCGRFEKEKTKNKKASVYTSNELWRSVESLSPLLFTRATMSIPVGGVYSHWSLVLCREPVASTRHGDRLSDFGSEQNMYIFEYLIPGGLLLKG